jgi:asparagine synthase (glutamine-hydrolysing)
MTAQRFATDHHELRLAPDAMAIMPRVARHHGEPFADPSAIATFHLSELVSREVTVVLTGDGGDESFGGYERYVLPRRLELADRTPLALRRAVAPLLRAVGQQGWAQNPRARLYRLGTVGAMDTAGLYARMAMTFEAPARAALLEPGFRGSEDGRAERFLTDAWAAHAPNARLDLMMATDVATYLPGDLLAKVDTATMAHSVEARAPLLDQELMAFAASLPPALKRDGSEGKIILKSALRGRLPDPILARAKMGFAVPMGPWLRDGLVGVARDLLLDRDAATAAYLRRDVVERLCDEQAAGVMDHALRIWTLMMLETWHREVADAAPSA